MKNNSFLSICALILWICSIGTAWAQNPVMTPLSDEAKKAMIAENTAVLDKMVGSWKADHTWAEGAIHSELEISKIVNGLFYEGKLVGKDDKGVVIYEARLIFSFNLGGLKHLMYVFESTGWAKQFIGEPNPEAILVQGMTTKGVEHFRWRIVDGNLERAYWNPGIIDLKTAPPDDVVVFKKVK